MTEIPTLRTERLILRPWREADLDPFAEHYADEESARFVGGVCARADVWRRIASYIGHWELRGFGFWALEEAATGAFVGYAGPWCPESWPEKEIGWGLMKAQWGRGFATEAARRARAYVYETLGWTTAVSYIDADNAASRRVAERLGAVPDGTAATAYFTADVYRHPSPTDLA